MPFRPQFWTDAVGPGGEDDPNTTAPAPWRIFTAPPDPAAVGGFSAIMWAADGDGLEVTLWMRNPSSGKWVQMGPLETITTRLVSTPISVPADAELFVQFGANVGPVTTFGVSFVD